MRVKYVISGFVNLEHDFTFVPKVLSAGNLDEQS